MEEERTTSPLSYSWAELAKCATDELGKRAGPKTEDPDAFTGVYGALVKAGKLDKAKAKREIGMMRQIASFCNALAARGGHGAFILFNDAEDRDEFLDWIKKSAKLADKIGGTGVF
jgi:hypothetical protein